MRSEEPLLRTRGTIVARTWYVLFIVVVTEYRGKGNGTQGVSVLARKAASLVWETSCVVVSVVFTMRD